MGVTLKDNVFLLKTYLASKPKFIYHFHNFKNKMQLLSFQVMFMLYMVIAAMLLVNMLIAMMGTTYQVKTPNVSFTNMLILFSTIIYLYDIF